MTAPSASSRACLDETTAAGRRDGTKERHPPTTNETMDALAPLKQLNELEVTQRGPGGLPGWSPLPGPQARRNP